MAGTQRPPTLEHAMTLKALVYLSLIALAASLAPAVYAQTYATIYPFLGTNGATPTAGVTIKVGNLWGTTSTGGSNGSGTVYELMEIGNNWVGGDLFAFPSNVANPQARLIFGLDGHPYG